MLKHIIYEDMHIIQGIRKIGLLSIRKCRANMSMTLQSLHVGTKEGSQLERIPVYS